MLVMAHRLSTILSADRVIMLDQEQVVASGCHADLVAVVVSRGGLVYWWRQDADFGFSGSGVDLWNRQYARRPGGPG